MKLGDAAGAGESDDAISDARRSIFADLGRHISAETRSVRCGRMTEVTDDDSDAEGERGYCG